MKTMGPNSHDYSDRYFESLVEQGRFDEAHAVALTFAKGGGSRAQMKLGWLYQVGEGVRKDLDQARHWYGLAVGSESPRAEFYLGSVYWSERSFAEAIEWFRKAAAQGYSPAAYQLARMYRHGIGVRPDRKLARKYVEDAAQGGHLFARRDIARAMLKGHYGLIRAPLGLVRLVQTVWFGFRVASKDTDDERFFRL